MARPERAENSTPETNLRGIGSAVLVAKPHELVFPRDDNAAIIDGGRASLIFIRIKFPSAGGHGSSPKYLCAERHRGAWKAIHFSARPNLFSGQALRSCLAAILTMLIILLCLSTATLKCRSCVGRLSGIAGRQRPLSCRIAFTRPPLSDSSYLSSHDDWPVPHKRSRALFERARNLIPGGALGQG